MIDMTKAQPHSIWLCTQGPLYDQMAADIGRLASAINTDTFAPHVTLLGDLTGSPADTFAACRRVFGAATSIKARVTGIAQTEDFFMSLFLDLDDGGSLRVAREQIAKDLSVKIPEQFRPHISLAYGHTALDPQGVCQLNDRYTGQEITLQSVAVVASAKEIPIAQWHILSSMILIP
ncbi:MAG: 2'-5' RNA ligase family protein [Roseobacter sp.]